MPATEPSSAPSRADRSAHLPGVDLPPPPPQRVVSEASPVKHVARRKWTQIQVSQQLQVVEGLLTQGSNANQIKQALARPPLNFSLGYNRVTALMARVREKWRDEDESARVAWKSAQIRRLHNHLRKAQGREPNKQVEGDKGEKINHSAVLGYENLLADLQGTKEPILVNVDVRYTEALTLTVASLTPDEIESWIDEYDTTMADAARARELGVAPSTQQPAPGKVA